MTQQLTKMEQLLVGLELVGGWQFDVLADVDTEILEVLADHAGDLDALAQLVENQEYTIYSGCRSMEDVVRQMENDGILDIQHTINGNDYYFDYDALDRDMDCGGEWSSMAYSNAEDIVNGHDNYIDHLPEELQERIRENWDMLQDNSDLINDVSDWIYEFEMDDDYRTDWMREKVGCSDNEWLARYFDYAAYGRDLEIEGTFEEISDGYIEIH